MLADLFSHFRNVHQQQLISGNKISFPEAFYNLNFRVLKLPNRSICIRLTQICLGHKTIWEQRRQRFF